MQKRPLNRAYLRTEKQGLRWVPSQFAGPDRQETLCSQRSQLLSPIQRKHTIYVHVIRTVGEMRSIYIKALSYERRIERKRALGAQP